MKYFFWMQQEAFEFHRFMKHFQIEVNEVKYLLIWKYFKQNLQLTYEAFSNWSKWSEVSSDLKILQTKSAADWSISLEFF